MEEEREDVARKFTVSRASSVHALGALEGAPHSAQVNMRSVKDGGYLDVPIWSKIGILYFHVLQQ